MAHEAVEIARHPSELIDLASEAREDAEALARMLLAPADEPTPLRETSASPSGSRGRSRFRSER